jgi:hypothetical protein
MPEFGGALDRWLDPPCPSERDALFYEQQEEAFYAEVRGERCPVCHGKTTADIDNGRGYIVCRDEVCDWQRSEAL